jgi:hypothetical protein
VTVRSNPESGELRAIVRLARARRPQATPSPQPGTPAPTAVTIASVVLSPSIARCAPARRFDVVMHGTPGGHASFDIGDYLTGLEMSEAVARRLSGTSRSPTASTSRACRSTVI